MEESSGLYAALSKAQLEFKVAVFDKKGLYGPYASFRSVREASIEALSKHGLSIIQPIEFDGTYYTLHTILNHSSGSEVRSSMRLILDKQNMQGLGSAVTYAKRYGWAAMIGIVSDDDDDGNAAVGSPGPHPEDIVKKKLPPPPKPKAKAPLPPSQFPDEDFDPVFEAVGTHSDYVVPFGTIKGTPLTEIPEDKLREMLSWARESLRKHPQGKDAALIAEFQVEATRFFKSVGLDA